MIYLGNNKIDSIYFGDYFKQYAKNFEDPLWEVNTENGWEVEFTQTQAIIKKFKIDTWGIRRTIKQPADIYNLYNTWKVKVSGLQYVNDNIVTFGNAYFPTGGWLGYNDTTAFAPGKFPNETYPNCYYVSGLIIQAGGHYVNMADTVKYPSEQMLMHPWDVRNRKNVSDGTITGTWYDGSYRTILIGLYGSLENHLGEIYDISDHPIVIELFPDLIDPQSEECWKVYFNGQIQEKDKTFENNWIKYKYVTSVGTNPRWSLTSANFISEIKDPPMISNPNFNGEIQIVDNNLKRIKPWTTFNYKAKSESFWTPIKEWFANNDWTNPIAFYTSHSTASPSLFGGSNISGELTLNFNTIDSKIFNARIVAFPDIIYGTQISKINFNFKQNCEGVSMLNAFRNATKLTEITTNKPFLAVELAGVFEFCQNLQKIGGYFNYSWRSRYNTSNLCYTYEGCTKLTEVAKSDYAENIDSAQNIIRTDTLVQTFNQCQNLVNFYPILDISGCSPDSTYKAFAGCTSLTHILIKNLNKGDWRFDGTSTKELGNLNNLDTESVTYLLNNVRDIAHLVPDTESQNNSFGHSSWVREDTGASYTMLYIWIPGFNNYCKNPVDNLQIRVSDTAENPSIYFLPENKIGSSDMENYKVQIVNGIATLTSNGETNYGFYVPEESFLPDNPIYLSLIKAWDRDGSPVQEAKIWIPEIWKTENRFTQNEIDVCNSRGWHIYIGDNEITTI